MKYIVKPISSTYDDGFLQYNNPLTYLNYPTKHLEVPDDIKMHYSYDEMNGVYTFTISLRFKGQKIAFQKVINGSYSSMSKNEYEVSLRGFYEHFLKTWPDEPEEVNIYLWNQLVYFNVPEPAVHDNHSLADDISKSSRRLPAMESRVHCPVSESVAGSCIMQTLWRQIQHLNDYHKWAREDIADWIDALHDKGIINAEFEQWDEDVDTTDPVV